MTICRAAAILLATFGSWLLPPIAHAADSINSRRMISGHIPTSTAADNWPLCVFPSRSFHVMFWPLGSDGFALMAYDVILESVSAGFHGPVVAVATGVTAED